MWLISNGFRERDISLHRRLVSAPNVCDGK